MAANPIAPVAIGQRYELIELLGAGGMGIVYLATDHLTGDTVALKQVATPIPQSASSSPKKNTNINLALAQEFRTMASLRHPNVVTVLDYGFDRQGQPYFTMEYIKDGKTIVEAGKDVSTGEKIDLIIQLLQALIYLHRGGVLHRDLKPGNVLVVNSRVKVLDFGLSVLTEKSVEYKTESTTGTFAYMAPELFAGEPFSRASDLYAVGVMAYEVFAGEYPFDRSNVMVLINEIISKTPDPKAAGVDEEIARVLDKLLTKKREERYKLAEVVIRDLCQAAKIPMPPETEEIRESFLQAAKFVGREQEMDQLWQVWQTARTGKGSAWLIGGESGVGKSRLIDEFQVGAMVDGALVLEGQAVREGAEPHALWRSAIRRLCLHANLSDRDAGILKALVTDIGVILGREIEDAPLIDPQSMQERLVDTVERLFRQQEQPILLLLEDLQWASENLPILNQLCRVVEELPLLIVGCYRDDERPGLPEKIPCSQVLKLGRLNQDAIGELSEAMLGEAGREARVVDLITRETEGNAYFIVEIVRTLAEEAGELDKIDTIALPEHILAGGVQEVVQRRLNQAPVEARPLLRLAAVAGRELDLKLLLSISGETDLGTWLRTCAGVSILEVYNNQWRFTHDKLREQLLADMSDDERRTLNEKVAEAATKLYKDEDHWAARLAYYWTEAGDAERAIIFLLQASSRAIKLSANEEAIGYLNRGLELLPALPDNSERIRQELNLLVALGPSLIASKGYAASEVEQTYSRARELCGQMEETAQLLSVLSGLCTYYMVRPDYQKGREIAKQFLEQSQRVQDIPYQATALFMLGGGMTWQGELESAREYLERSIDLADVEQCRHLIFLVGLEPGLFSRTYLAYVLWLLGYPDQGLKRTQEALALAHEIDIPFGLAYTFCVSGVHHYFRREEQIVREQAEAAIAVAAEYGLPQWMAQGGILRGWALVQQGEGCEEHCAQMHFAMDAWRATGADVGRPYYLLLLAQTHVKLGQIEEGLDLLTEALTLTENNREYWMIAELYRVKGELLLAQSKGIAAAEAEDCFHQALKFARQQNAKSLELRAVMSLSRLWQKQGKREDAQQMLAEIYGWFTEGFDTVDLQEAKTLLKELSV